MKRRMQGFSLVELMVALTMGLFISAAAIQIFISNQVALNFQRGMNDVQANGRFAIDQMIYDIRLSGLQPSNLAASGSTAVPGVPFDVADIPGLPNTSTALNRNAAASATGATPVPGLLDDSDQIVVQYLVMSDTQDCEGNTVAAGRYLVARYFIRSDNGVPSLACDAGSHDGTTLDATAGSKSYDEAGTVLLNGVDSFQVQYGVDDRIVDDKANKVARIARYIDAKTYKDLALPRPTVLSVRIGLYLHSQERASANRLAAAADPDAPAIRVLDESIPVATVPNDGFLRRLFVTTVSLRNVVMSGV